MGVKYGIHYKLNYKYYMYSIRLLHAIQGFLQGKKVEYSKSDTYIVSH